jgi:hypothetical protein
VEQAENAKVLDRLRHEHEERKRMNQQAVSDSVAAFSGIMSAATSMHSSRLKEITAEKDAEIARIRESGMSEKQKADAIKRIEAEKKKVEIEAAKRQATSVALIGAANTALAIQQAILLALNAGTTAPPGLKVATVATVTAAMMGYVAQVKGAQAAIPKREYGGGTRRGGLYEVAEKGKPEVYSEGGKDFLFSGGGIVTPIKNYNTGGGNTYNITVVESSNARMTAREVVHAISQADRNGEVDWAGMRGLQRSVRG